MVSHTENNVLLMDSSKVGKSSTFTFATPDQVDIVISDDDLPDSFLAMCERESIEVL